MTDESGALYANQDADLGTRGGAKMKGPAYYALDDRARRALGVPWIDKRIYAEHNGYQLTGLADLYAATHDEEVRAHAIRAMRALRESHLADGLYKHEAGPDEARYLVDQLAMGEALLAWFEATGEATYLDQSAALARATRAALFDKARGAFLVSTHAGARTPFQLGARAARWFLRLSLVSDRPKLKPLKEDAARALTFLARPRLIDDQGRTIGDFLLAAEELLEEPLHIAVVDDKAGPLYRAALAIDAPGRVLELAKPGGRFPDLKEPAAFVCGATFCSRPVFSEEALREVVASFLPIR